MLVVMVVSTPLFSLCHSWRDVTKLCTQFTKTYIAMWDLAHNETSHKIISEFHSKDRIIAAVCHGPAALAYAKLPSGKFLLENAPVTGFSNTEEEAYIGLSNMPFELETALGEASNGKFEKASDDWASHIVVANGGKIITGQNPASASGVGEAILAQLRKEGKSA